MNISKAQKIFLDAVMEYASIKHDGDFMADYFMTDFFQQELGMTEAEAYAKEEADRELRSEDWKKPEMQEQYYKFAMWYFLNYMAFDGIEENQISMIGKLHLMAGFTLPTQYMIYTAEGHAIPPADGKDIEAEFILGYAKGNSREEAVNNWLNEVGGIPARKINDELVTTCGYDKESLKAVLLIG